MTSPRVSGPRLDALVAQAREPVFVLGPDRRVVGVNPAFEELTGYSARQVAGLSCRAVASGRGGDLAGLGGSLHPPAETLAGQPSGTAALIVHAGGERRWRRVEFWPLHDADGALLGVFGVVRPTDAARHAPDAASQKLRSDLLEVRARLQRRHGSDLLIGDGPAHTRLLEQIRSSAASGGSACIVGEPGSGKRSVARAIHARSARRGSPLIVLDCAATSPEDLARELFGRDLYAEADGLAMPEGATVVLAEVLEIPRDLQERIAAALDGRVRVLALSTVDLEPAYRDDRLRADFYYALTPALIRLLPLRDRRGEIPLLAQHFLERSNRRGPRQREGFSPGALGALESYDWPGNLAELARVIDAAHASGPPEGDRIELDDVPAGVRGHLAGSYLPPAPPPSETLDEILTQVERGLIEQAMARSRRNKSRAAEILGISRPRLYRRIKELGLPDEPDPDGEASPRIPPTRRLPPDVQLYHLASHAEVRGRPGLSEARPGKGSASHEPHRVVAPDPHAGTQGFGDAHRFVPGALT